MYTILGIIKPASKYSFIIKCQFILPLQQTICGGVHEYWIFVFASRLTPRNQWGLSVLPSKTRTHQPVLKIWQLISFSFSTFSTILQMQDTDCPSHSFQNLISFWLECPLQLHSQFRNRDFSTHFSGLFYLPEWISLWVMSWQVFISPHLLNAGSIWGITHNNNPTECLYQQRWRESQLAALEFPFVREIPGELWALNKNSLILEYFPIWTSCSGNGLGETVSKERR